ncbi:alpha/beta fold hydrolase [Paraburkholderia sp. MM5477-R1]|uniref:alpha/beta fold hydrolase n=1 Tax=Paraburkholderia sp. MM5477-R1 TaxID=2991062 RepID=UPI003D21754A
MKTDVDGTSWNWVRQGTLGSPVVVLIHAVGLDLSYWEKQIQLLAPNYDVIAVDLPGHGQSAAPPADWSFEKAAAGIVAVLDDAAVRAAHLIGLSIGGMIAQEVAISYPARVRSLMLLATAAAFSDEARAAMLQHAALAEARGMEAVLPFVHYWVTSETARDRPDIIDRISLSLLRLDASDYALIWRMIAGFDASARLGTVRCPTVVLVGDRDLNTPEAYAVLLAAAVQQGNTIVLPGASHLIPLDLPVETASAIEKWLAHTESH